MKVDAEIISLPAVDWGGGDTRDVSLLKITTPDGMTGLGSAYTGVRQVLDALALYQADPQALQTSDAETTIAMSAIDIALWDIRGKAEGRPVSELLGGRMRDRVLAYATVDLPMTTAKAGDEFDQILRSIVARGFKAIKLCIEDFGRRDNCMSDREWDRREARLLEFARRIVGEDVQPMLDVYGSDPSWTADFDWAQKTAKVLETLGYLWFEEPLAPGDFEDFTRLTRKTGIAIAGGEDFILQSDFEKLARLKAVNILQPDCTRVGGLTRMQAIRQSGGQDGLHVIPHGWNTAVGLAADLQFQAAAPGGRYCMVEFWPSRTITDLLKGDPFALDNEGKIVVPTGAGLGVELIEDLEATMNSWNGTHVEY
jgi:L-alanine-DL-glutamate epimerase-like enolase superfamily enzyme